MYGLVCYVCIFSSYLVRSLFIDVSCVLFLKYVFSDLFRLSVVRTLFIEFVRHGFFRSLVY